MNKEEIFSILYGKETFYNYHQFQQIEEFINESNSLYIYFDDVSKMLKDEKSFIRVRGFRIICQLSKWDIDNKIDLLIYELLDILDDEKPTNVRQCLKALEILIKNKNYLSDNILNKLNKIDYLRYKDTMSPLIKKDIDNLIRIINS